MPRAYSSREIAEIIGADPSSVNRWIDSGEMKAFRTPGGHRRVLGEDLAQFLEKCGMPIPHELRPASESILIVDDDEVLAKSLQRALQRAQPGINVDFCNSGIEALIRIGSNHPDAVVLDVYMPGLDGVAVCEKLKGNPNTASVKVICVTGKPSVRLEHQLQEAGADAILVKPLKASTLLKVINDTRK